MTTIFEEIIPNFDINTVPNRMLITEILFVSKIDIFVQSG